MTNSDKQTPSRCGYPLSIWEAGIDEIRQILVERIKSDKQPITYSELCRELKTIRMDHFGTPMNYILGDLSQEEMDADRPLLTAAIVSADTGAPAGTATSGWYDQARKLGYQVDTEDQRITAWITEYQKCVEYWKAHDLPADMRA